MDVQVNKIRQSLQLVARNSTAFGLHQPHMERTKLCELGDDQLDKKYLEQRAQLHELVQQLAKPKRVNGKVMTGPGLAELVSQMVTALNARDIPTAGSILEHFNKELVYRCTSFLSMYSKAAGYARVADYRCADYLVSAIACHSLCQLLWLVLVI